MVHEPGPAKWSEPDVDLLLNGLSYDRENDPKYPIPTRALGLAMAIRKRAKHEAMGSTEYMAEDLARDRLVLIGGHVAMFDLAMKYLDRADAVIAADVNAEEAARRVQAAAPRLANVTNLTVISFSFLDGTRTALDQVAPFVGNDVREIADDYYITCASMTVMRVALLLDRDDLAVSFQSVYRRMRYPEVVEALIRQVCDDPLQIEESVRHSVNEFLRIYKTIDRKLHGRLSHFRNLGIAHLDHELRKRITHDELRNLVRLVKDLAACLAPLTVRIPPVRGDEILDRTDRPSAAADALHEVAGGGAEGWSRLMSSAEISSPRTERANVVARATSGVCIGLSCFRLIAISPMPWVNHHLRRYRPKPRNFCHEAVRGGLVLNDGNNNLPPSDIKRRAERDESRLALRGCVVDQPRLDADCRFLIRRLFDPLTLLVVDERELDGVRDFAETVKLGLIVEVGCVLWPVPVRIGYARKAAIHGAILIVPADTPSAISS